MEQTPGVVDIDDISVAPQTKAVFEVDRAKAALHGISAEQIAAVLGAAGAGAPVSSLRRDEEVNPLRIVLQLPRQQRSRTAQLEQFTVRGMTGEAVLLAELGRFTETQIDQPVYHKNLKPVAYVFGDTAGLDPGEAVLTLSDRVRHEPALAGYRVNWAGEGEWEVTLRVFRDLGAAFAVAVLGIYILLLYQTQSFLLSN